jgi:phage gp36-like protein
MYVTVTELFADLDQSEAARLTDDENRGESAIDWSDDADAATARVIGAIAEACDEIDASLRGRYDVPLVSPPLLVKRIAKALTVRRLHARRPTDGLPSSVIDEGRAALDLLRAIGRGDALLEGASVADVRPIEIAANRASNERAFSDDTLERY